MRHVQDTTSNDLADLKDDSAEFRPISQQLPYICQGKTSVFLHKK